MKETKEVWLTKNLLVIKGHATDMLYMSSFLEMNLIYFAGGFLISNDAGAEPPGVHALIVETFNNQNRYEAIVEDSFTGIWMPKQVVIVREPVIIVKYLRSHG